MMDHTGGWRCMKSLESKACSPGFSSDEDYQGSLGRRCKQVRAAAELHGLADGSGAQHRTVLVPQQLVKTAGAWPCISKSSSPPQARGLGSPW